jgi:hypothetical protein
MVKRLTLYLAFLVVLSIAASCGVPKAPKEVEKKALEGLSSQMQYLNTMMVYEWEWRDAKVTEAKSLSITPADKANSVEEKWLVTIQYIMRKKHWTEDTWEPWEDQSISLVVQKVKGEWMVEQ